VPYEFVDDVNDPHFINHLKSLKPDIIISCQAQIFSEKLLNVARIACINCHSAKLPKYRGPHPILAAMINREDTIGVTVHSMTKEIDKGAIICQKEFATSKEYSLLVSYVLAYDLFSEVILNALDLIDKKDISELAVVPNDAPYFKSPSLEDLKKLCSSGLRMV
jgi:methionyl-tRNA formyltransferase